MEYPYQLVTFFDQEPDIGECVYQGERGWYPQIALKRRFAFNGVSEEDGLKMIERFIASNPPLQISFGRRLQPSGMPVVVIEVVDSPEVTNFHNGFFKVLGQITVSKFPEREGENYYPHMTATWKGEDVVRTEEFEGGHRAVSNVWVLKDDAENGDSRAYRKYSLAVTQTM